MVRIVIVLMSPALAWAGAHDYYACEDAAGAVRYSVERCRVGESESRISDDVAPRSVRLGSGQTGVVRLERRGGHFYTDLEINGHLARAIVDTGASFVSMGPSTARRLGVDSRRGRVIPLSTANGMSHGVLVRLPLLTLGGNRLHEVDAVVSQVEMPGGELLLGMSALGRFDIRIDGAEMTLRPK